MALTKSPGVGKVTPNLLLPAFLGGLAFVLVGERMVTSDEARYLFTGLGALAVVGATLLRLPRAAAGGERGRAERALAVFSAIGVLALAVYAATTETGRQLLGVTGAKPEARARFEALTSAAIAALLVFSVLPLVLGEMALAPMRRARVIEARRVRSAIGAGVVMASAVVYCSLFTFAAGELDVKADYSFFRTARPSESTKKIAASATEPIEIRAFFPQLNEVGAEVVGYLREVADAAPNVRVTELDRLLEPTIAKEAKATNDGVIVLTRGASRDSLAIGIDMKTAAVKLKSLDADFQKSFLKVLRAPRVAYLTVGHGELNEARGTEAAEGHTAKSFRKLLENQNYTVKDLGLTQGLATDVPTDATIVVVLGPTHPFLPEEIASLKRYAEQGGHLLLGLEPEAKVDLDPLAGLVGLTWTETVLANDKFFVRRRNNPSDRANLATNKYSSHASVSTLSRNAARMPIVVPGASSLDKRKDAGNAKIDFAVKSMPETFEDKQGTFEFDGSAEKRGSFNLAAAVTRAVVTPGGPSGPKGKDAPEMRAFVLADADAFSDAAFGNEPNVLFAADVLRWLGGEESYSGAIATSEDVRIEHTKQKDVVWFFATIFGAPLGVVGLGVWIGRRARRTKKTAAKESGR